MLSFGPFGSVGDDGEGCWDVFGVFDPLQLTTSEERRGRRTLSEETSVMDLGNECRRRRTNEIVLDGRCC